MTNEKTTTPIDESGQSAGFEASGGDVLLKNLRDTFDALCAMRNSINEYIPMPSIESDLLNGPETSVFCAVVAESVIAAVRTKDTTEIVSPDDLQAALEARSQSWAHDEYVKTTYNADDKRPEPTLTADMLPFEKEALSLMTKIGVQISRPNLGMVLVYFKMMREIGQKEAAVDRKPVDPSALSEAPLTVSYTAHQIAHNVLIAHTGQEGGCPRIDWYKLRSEISDAIAVALGDQRKRDAQPPTHMRGSQALNDIASERCRQIEAEGWDTTHDDQHLNGELRRAAASYIASASDYPSDVPPPIWPWSSEWWKPTERRRDLIKAGALIIAEIERLDRAAEGSNNG